MLTLVGGNGFLARHTCELFQRNHQPALVVSRDPDGRFLERFAPSLEVMSAGEFASAAGREVIAQSRAIVYFTWSSVVSTFADNPWREISENVAPAFAFFQRVAKISNDVRIVFISSGGTVYGVGGERLKSEKSPTEPISPYGVGKLMAEEALRFVGRTEGSPFAILRISNAVGRWQTSDKQGVIRAALRAARDAVPMHLFGGGAEVRDFVDADDVAEAIYAACIDTAHRDATWNVGSEVGIPVRELIDSASRIIGRPILVKQAPRRNLDVPHVVLDCQKIKRDLGWTAKIPIEHSISTLWEAICRSA